MKYTKLIWTIGKIKHSKNIDRGGHIHINTIGWDSMAKVAFTPNGFEEGLLNAKLIAAAPELLDALLSIVNTIEKNKTIRVKQILAANKAIDKVITKRHEQEK